MAEPIRFDTFMRRALYDPERGYYARRIRGVGARGDFSTAATLGGELARALARWARRVRGELGPGRRWHLIELGGGGGDLMAGVLDALDWWTRRFVTAHVVEISAPLRAQQRERLAGRDVRWHATVREALDAAGGRAVLFGIEFVDAFPCRVLRRVADRWEELWLATTDTERVEDFRAARDLPELPFSALESDHPVGQRVEIQPAVREWLAAASASAERAALLLVDYGDTADALYAGRPGGTLRAYFQQQRISGPAVYRAPGRQDLTVDVNFSDLRVWARDLGWREADYVTQAAFLARELGDAPADAAAAFLRREDGAGAAFKVLDLRR